MYNVRVKKFYDSEQIQIFTRVQRSKGEIYKKKIDKETGEIFPPKKKTTLVEFEDGTEFRGSQMPNEEESLRISCSRTIKSVYDISRSDAWEWFFTLTFNKDKVDRYDFSATSKKMSVWLNNMRKKCPNMKYIVVPEQHKDGAWHFHGLFKNIDNLDFIFSGKHDKKGREIYNCQSYKWGFTTATKVTDFRKASSYLCKYITKDLCQATKGKKRYWASRNVNRPQVEEYYYNPDYLNLVLIGMSNEDAHLKSIDSQYGSVNYIDQSIPQTRKGFAKE